MGLTSRGDGLEDEQRPRQLASRRRAADLSPVQDTMGPNGCFEVGHYSGRTNRGGGGVSRCWLSWQARVLLALHVGWVSIDCRSPAVHRVTSFTLATFRSLWTTLGQNHGHRNLHLRTLYNESIDTKLRIESPRRLQQISRLVVSVFFSSFLLFYTHIVS